MGKKVLNTSHQSILEYWRGERDVKASKLRAKKEGLDPEKQWGIFHYYITNSKTGTYTDTLTGDVYSIDECALGADISELHSHCWRCGCEWGNHGAGRVERCHLIPRQFEDKYKLSPDVDDPCNIILLCSKCHKEAPDTLNPKDTFDWIRETRASSYNCFWDARAHLEFATRSGRINETGVLSMFVYLIKNKVKSESSLKEAIRILNELPDFVKQFKKSETEFCKEGLGVHFRSFSIENCYILQRRRELFWLDKIKEVRRTISKTEASLIKKNWGSYLERVTNKHLANSLPAAMMMGDNLSSAPNILDNPTLPSLLPQVEKILE